MKKILPILFIINIFSGFILAQAPENISTHQEHIKTYGPVEKLAGKFDINGKDIIPIQSSQAKALSKIVFGFLPDWEYNSGAHNNMHYELLTHLAVFNFLANSEGKITNPSGWPWTDVINAAHSNGTKVIMAITNFGGTESAMDVVKGIMDNTTVKTTFFNNIKSLINSYQLDGVNIDFEALSSDYRGAKLNNFMKELTTFIHTELPGKEVSFDGPAVNWGGWDLDGLTQSVDHVFIMAYDYHGSFSDNTGAVAPLTHPSGGISLTKTLSNDYSVPKSKTPEKLILGVPYYGKHWKTATSTAGSSITSYVGSTFYKDDISNAATKGGYIWDNNSQTPWYKWNSGGWHQIWSDNETSLGKKYDLSLTENLGGIGIWALNYDGNRSELWNLISTKFGGATTPIPGVPMSAAAISKDATGIQLKFEAGNHATSYLIYQSTDNINYTMVKEDTGTTIDIDGLTEGEVYYYKIAAKNSAGTSGQTKATAAMPSLQTSEILIVDGVERRGNIDAITQYDLPLSSLGRTYSSAANEAIINGLVNLNDFKFVIWMLLDESTADDTLNKEEQAKIKAYIDNGGVLIISGDEIGWDLGNSDKADNEDMTFYANYLKASYEGDEPSVENHMVKDNNNNAYSFGDGSNGFWNIDYPDIIKPINGSQKSFIYDGVSTSEGVAGVSYQTANGGVEYLAFALEAVYNDNSRKNLIQYLLNKYSNLLAVDDTFIKSNIHIYPNPTGGILKISNPNQLDLQKVEIYNLYGQRLKVSQNQNSIDISHLNSGIYMIKIEDKNGKQGTYKVLKN